ncbi:MAG TPA: hypothetical protein VI876_14020 [Dehalococcoidia bacterium]|nr:hypothetical protein [Dehalococcoidia bacterium]
MLEFQARLPNTIPTSLPVYRLGPDATAISDAGVQLSMLAQRLGMKGRAHESLRSDDWSLHREESWELGVHGRSGAIVGRREGQYLRGSDATFDLNDDRASEIASSFLRRTAIAPVREMRLRGVTHLRTAGGDERANVGREEILDAGVVIGRSVNGTEVDGPGGAAMVNVDATGEVVGFRCIWRPVGESMGRVKIIDPEIAQRGLTAIANRVRGDVLVTKASFGYFEQGMMDRQDYLQPAFVFVYVVRDDEVSYRSVEVVAASERTHELLQGEKRFPVKRKTRRRLEVTTDR